MRSKVTLGPIRIHIWPTIKYVRNDGYDKLFRFGKFECVQDRDFYVLYSHIGFPHYLAFNFKNGVDVSICSRGDPENVLRKTHYEINDEIHYDPENEYANYKPLKLFPFDASDFTDDVCIFADINAVEVTVFCECVCITCRDAENLLPLLAQLGIRGELMDCENPCGCAAQVAQQGTRNLPAYRYRGIEMRHEDDKRAE